jgi:hypothetical protein
MKPSVALTTALSGAYLARAIVVMIIVGSVLNLINQGEALFQGAFSMSFCLPVALVAPSYRVGPDLLDEWIGMMLGDALKDLLKKKQSGQRRSKLLANANRRSRSEAAEIGSGSTNTSDMTDLSTPLT